MSTDETAAFDDLPDASDLPDFWIAHDEYPRDAHNRRLLAGNGHTTTDRAESPTCGAFPATLEDDLPAAAECGLF